MAWNSLNGYHSRNEEWLIQLYEEEKHLVISIQQEMLAYEIDIIMRNIIIIQKMQAL